MGRRKKKKLPVGVRIIIFLIVVAVVAGGYYYNKIYLPSKQKDLYGKEVVYEHAENEITFHFPMLGNKYNGDCTYIKAGEIDILIDAGSRANSVPTIKSYVDKYCLDKTLEYVIVTHADQDHIAGFACSNSIFDNYDCEVIIDFPLTNKDTETYKNYIDKRDKEVENGAVRYSALECVKAQNGAKKVYELASNISMEILYHKYYEETCADENEYSVCVLFTHGDRSFLFTGDLEDDGEKLLVESNNLPEVALFKAGHHGSKTSSSEVLLNAIKPKICVVPCVAGYNEYDAKPENVFPTQAFVNRIAKHTDKVYIPTIWDEEKQKETALNGDIKIVSKETKVSVLCSNSTTLLRETDWFKSFRTMPAVWDFQ